MNFLLKFSIRYPKFVIALTLVSSLFILLNINQLTIKSSNLDLIDQSNPEVVNFLDFSKQFGTPNSLVVVLEGSTKEKLAQLIPDLQKQIVETPGVRKVISEKPDIEALMRGEKKFKFLQSNDEKISYVFVQPEDIRTDVTLMTPLVEKVQLLLDQAKSSDPDLKAGLTGIPKYALDDQNVISHDVNFLSWFSLGLVLLLYVIAFKSFWHPLLATVVVMFAVILTLGAAMIYPGHLTLLSAPFAMMVFGIGTDFGIHLISRYEELLAKKLSNQQAILQAGQDLSKTLLATCATTAAGFYVLVFSGFQGFQELGIIAGTGMIFSLLMMYTLLPATIIFIKTSEHKKSLLGTTFSLAKFCSSKFAKILAIILFLASLYTVILPSPGFNADYLSLQPKNSESVRLEREMVDGSEFSPYFAAFQVNSLKESAQITQKLKASLLVGSVKSLNDFLPGDATEAAIAELPSDLTDIFISPAKTYAVYAYPFGNIWDPEFEAQFLTRMREIHAGVTGMPFLGNTMMQQTKDALRITTLLAMVTLLIILIIDLKSIGLILLATAIPVLSMTATQGFMLFTEIRFNPLNIMALPIIVGVSIDHAIHIIHRFQEEHGDLAKTMAGAGKSVVLTNLTTLAAFGALAFTTHQGLRSFSLMLCAGVVMALILSVLILPQILVLFKSKFIFKK